MREFLKALFVRPVSLTSQLMIRGGRSATVRTGSEPVRVRTVTGPVWVTAGGGSGDTVLEAGEAVDIDLPGRVVVTAFADARVIVCTYPEACSSGQFARKMLPVGRVP